MFVPDVPNLADVRVACLPFFDPQFVRDLYVFFPGMLAEILVAVPATPEDPSPEWVAVLYLGMALVTCWRNLRAVVVADGCVRCLGMAVWPRPWVVQLGWQHTIRLVGNSYLIGTIRVIFSSFRFSAVTPFSIHVRPKSSQSFSVFFMLSVNSVRGIVIPLRKLSSQWSVRVVSTT